MVAHRLLLLWKCIWMILPGKARPQPILESLIGRRARDQVLGVACDLLTEEQLPELLIESPHPFLNQTEHLLLDGGAACVGNLK